MEQQKALHGGKSDEKVDLDRPDWHRDYFRTFGYYPEEKKERALAKNGRAS